MLAINKKEWLSLPRNAQQEVYDFFLFIKQQYMNKPSEIDTDTAETLAFSNHSANNIEDWLDEKEDDVWK